MELHVVPITKPEELNFIFGQSHFIKSFIAVEDEAGIAWRKGHLRTIGYKL